MDTVETTRSGNEVAFVQRWRLGGVKFFDKARHARLALWPRVQQGWA